MNAFADDEPVRVDLAPDAQGREQWVELRSELSVGVDDAFNAKMFVAKFDKAKLLAMKPGQEFDPKDVDLDIDIGRAMSSSATLESWIVDWQLYDGHGEPVQFSARAIGKLKKPIAAKLTERIKALEAANAGLGESSSVPATVT